MHSRDDTMTLQHWVHALKKRWQPLGGTATRTPPHNPAGEAPQSTLFMRSGFSAELKSKGFKIRIARRPSVLQDALGLLNRRYRQRGYGFQTLTMSPERMTIVAYEGQQVIGTLTVQLDHGRGLLSDECFREQLDRFRADGAALCEFTKLATAPQAPAPATLASMFHVAFIFAHQVSGATHAVVEVNPRHVSFYTRVLGFAPHGTPQSNPRVKAPGVLLVADFQHIGQQLLARNAHGSGSGETPPFFSHSFSNAEEKGIRNRIKTSLTRLENEV
ncbi:N-acetyltransferase [Acidovorax sp. ACV01]|uniref:N-acyl amino acid synthase FeeM domain-containing protein n=1 Tax=Acidovorax sp. ACV01 TaxID=2769311 RepID=UPI00177CC354|nr:N-acetyltransferase [Acidovorax sp. ACV01]MBD9394547.1 N-acetyltransferase [Acidovorax sp. ACV01]